MRERGAREGQHLAPLYRKISLVLPQSVRYSKSQIPTRQVLPIGKFCFVELTGVFAGQRHLQGQLCATDRAAFEEGFLDFCVVGRSI